MKDHKFTIPNTSKIGITPEDVPCVIEIKGKNYFVGSFDPDACFLNNRVEGLYSAYPAIEMPDSTGSCFSRDSRIAIECKVLKSAKFVFNS